MFRHDVNTYRHSAVGTEGRGEEKARVRVEVGERDPKTLRERLVSHRTGLCCDTVSPSQRHIWHKCGVGLDVLITGRALACDDRLAMALYRSYPTCLLRSRRPREPTGGPSLVFGNQGQAFFCVDPMGKGEGCKRCVRCTIFS